MLPFAGLHRRELRHGEVPGGEQGRREPAGQRGLDAPARGGVLRLPEHRRVSAPRGAGAPPRSYRPVIGERGGQGAVFSRKCVRLMGTSEPPGNYYMRVLGGKLNITSEADAYSHSGLSVKLKRFSFFILKMIWALAGVAQGLERRPMD